LSLTFGCRSVVIVSEPDPSTGKMHTYVVNGGRWKGSEWDFFKDSVQRPISKELAGDPPPVRKENWRTYWIGRAEGLAYTSKPDWIDYIITERRKHSLPEIPDLNTRRFRTPWQLFTDSCDPQIERESQGLTPPLDAKNWPDYWLSEFEILRLNKNIGEAGVAYIMQKREDLHLPRLLHTTKTGPLGYRWRTH
jgi:hypothetical protein